LTRICYQPWRFQAAQAAIVRQANAICAELAEQGYDMTLRQLYYQFVARDLLPNTTLAYDRLGDIVNKARLAGHMDWESIVDRTRNLRQLGHYDTPAAMIAEDAQVYRLDKWDTQPSRVEVWVEKDALAGVIAQVANRLDVAWFACRGNVSQSEMWIAAQRFLGYIAAGQRVVVLHLGDHDPNGIDMTRDIADRLQRFVEHDRPGAGDEVEVRRVALTYAQVQQYAPPPNPAKEADSRFAAYVSQFGDQSWELDALQPAVIDALVEDAVLQVRDEAAYAARERIEDGHRRVLGAAAQRWDEIEEVLA
jgi:hypothetical protein